MLNNYLYSTITQEEVDNIFLVRDGSYYELEDCKKIQNTIKDKFNINISLNEAKEFWIWRSNCYAASWLIIHSQEEIIEWFKRFVEERRVKDDE